MDVIGEIKRDPIGAIVNVLGILLGMTVVGAFFFGLSAVMGVQ